MFSNKLPVFNLPFKSVPNCSITLKRETGILVADPATGNQYPEVEEITVEAFVTFYNSRQKTEAPQGASVNELPIKGYLVNPKILPDGFQLDGVLPMIYTRSNGVQEVGTLTIEGIYTPYEENLNQVTGTPIRGAFRRSHK